MATKAAVSVIVAARVPAWVREALEKMARRRSVNLSEFLRWHLIDLVEAAKRKGGKGK
ncbi:MAG: hypothetical protein HY716_17260 [Planctomycetes bacterium]|nr:hypothetical protein [Planctomycetota bacterium]